MEFMSLALFIVAIRVLLAGFTGAFSLAGTGLLCAFIGFLTGHLHSVLFDAWPHRPHCTNT